MGKQQLSGKRWFLFEAYLSVSTGIARHGFVFPEFDDANFAVEGFFHPVLKKTCEERFCRPQAGDTFNRAQYVW
jgi:hypothetical protein